MSGSDAPDPSSRRDFLADFATLSGTVCAAGLVTPAIADASAKPTSAAGTATAASDATIGDATIAEAEKLAGIAFTETERGQIVRSIAEQLDWFKARAAFGPLDEALAPAQVFRVLLPGESPRAPRDDGEAARESAREGDAAKARATTNVTATATPARADVPSDDDLDWASVEDLGAWMRAGRVTSRRLVERSLERLRRTRARLFHVVTLVEEPALAEADARDAEMKAGRLRGPLHGIPYGLKDILDTAGIATTFGAEPFRDRVPARDAAVAARLREAGAVCVAKTAVGALAYGDVWFGGTCRNPWDPEQGSSGSSAGSASAVAAGCVPFAIGSETLGSIVSPCERCATTGLRPTFGRVARDGAMALSWSWDKIGPIARHVVDAGLVLEAMNGASDLDPSSVAFPFVAPRQGSARGLRIAFDPRWFAGPMQPLRAALEAAQAAGAELLAREIAPPADPSILLASLTAEAAAAFEQLTRSGRDDMLGWQDDDAWPNTFRKTWFVPAIELVQVDRIRRVFMQWMRETLAGVDLLAMPPYAGGMLTITNATGHPALSLRAVDPKSREPRSRAANDAPVSIVLVGHPFDESTLLAGGAAIEAELALARIRPSMAWLS